MATEYIQGLQALPTSTIKQRIVNGTASAFLGRKTGSPQHLASGWIYGIPDTPGQIDDHFYSDVGYRYGRAGGSQLANARGWYRSTEDYQVRFASALSNYRTTRLYKGSFIYLISDTWGADGGQPPDAPYPGDNGDWTSWDNLLTCWIEDIKANDMIEGLVLDIWNEPDLKFFWNRPQKQWLDMWSRTYHRLRKEVPSLLLSGPALSAPPRPGHEWWTAFLEFVVQDHSIPDQFAWHMETGEDDMQTAMDNFRELLKSFSLPQDIVVNINEYAVWSEQFPSAGTWWISQLERSNAIGLRGNWAIAGALHDFFAGLLAKQGAGTESYDPKARGYYPTAEFHVYKYYASSMKGERVQTFPTPDKNGDIYVVLGEDKVRILAGTRCAEGTWFVELRDVDSIGLKDGDAVDVRILAFTASEDHFERNDGPQDLGSRKVVCVSGSLRLEIYQANPLWAYAFEVDYRSC